MSSDPITIGIHEDHNAGIAVMRAGRVLAYCEWERITRQKNQAGWFGRLAGDIIARFPLEEIGAVCAHDVGNVRELFVERFGGVVRAPDSVDVGAHRIQLFGQDDLHTQLHMLATFSIGTLEPGIYAALVFDADQPRISWIDTRVPLPDEFHFQPTSAARWFNGGLFADFFGPMFYGSNDLTNTGKLMGLSEWGTPASDKVEWLSSVAQEVFDDAACTWQGYLDASAPKLRALVRDRWSVDSWDHGEGSAAIDLAASAQRLFTSYLVGEVVRGLACVREAVAARGLPAPLGVLYGGGCALSVVSNGAMRDVLDIPLIVPPFAHDASQFVGAAVYASLRIGGRVTATAGWPAMPALTEGVIRAEQLREADIPYEPMQADAIAERLAAGQLIALVEGGAEAGPRALGQRSLLANPLDPRMRGRINDDVKHREWYRPFAPALPRERFAFYFGHAASPAATYMLDAYTFRPEFRQTFRSVSTPGGLARPQAVGASTSPRFHELLRAFGNRTGHPVLLNTSLNAPGKTIAFDLEQVVEDCVALGLDAAIVDGMVVEQAALIRHAENRQVMHA
jgi:predicted NodU family carbamoyl transferase